MVWLISRSSHFCPPSAVDGWVGWLVGCANAAPRLACPLLTAFLVYGLASPTPPALPPPLPFLPYPSPALAGGWIDVGLVGSAHPTGCVVVGCTPCLLPLPPMPPFPLPCHYPPHPYPLVGGSTVGDLPALPSPAALPALAVLTPPGWLLPARLCGRCLRYQHAPRCPVILPLPPRARAALLPCPPALPLAATLPLPLVHARARIPVRYVAVPPLWCGGRAVVLITGGVRVLLVLSVPLPLPDSLPHNTPATRALMPPLPRAAAPCCRIYCFPNQRACPPRLPYRWFFCGCPTLPADLCRLRINLPLTFAYAFADGGAILRCWCRYVVPAPAPAPACS